MSRFSSSLHVGRPTGVCSVSGRALEPGEVYVATLCEDDAPESEFFVRKDVALLVWDAGDRPAGLFSFWRTTVPTGNQKGHALVGDDVLLDLYERLADDDRPQRVAFRFVLVLILMRKRVLKFIGRETRDGTEIWHIRRRGQGDDGTPDEVVNPCLSDADIQDMAEQLSDVLQSDL